GVRGHDPSCTVRYVGARRGELDAEDILGALDVWVGEGFACGELVAEGDGGDGDGTVRILKDKRPLGCREWATHEGATRIGQCSPGADAVTRIVVAGDHDDRDLRLGCNAGQETVELTDGGLRRGRTVEDVAGDDQHIGGVRLHGFEDLFKSGRVVVLKR